MSMYLRMIAVEASDLATVPKEPPFRWTAHHVKEVFFALLPRKFVLDGSSKVQITCGPPGDEPQYRQLLGTTEYFKEDFNFSLYYRLTSRERDELLLQALEESFLEIGTRHGWSEENRDTVMNTARAVRVHDFSLRIGCRKLSRRKPCRQLRVNVFRNLNREDGEAWSCELTDRDGKTIHEEWFWERPDYLDRTDFYKSSEWNGHLFEVRERFGKVVYRLDTGPFCADCETQG